ncbi:MAG: hypothetical protein H0U49_08830 [Parachlamydiaceae bacterium]|nr:hypothetical protein [Parachlamydiaceae bacterium]
MHATMFPQTEPKTYQTQSKQNHSSKKRLLTWHEYDKQIVEFFLKTLRSQEKPDFIVGVSEDSMVLANALSRLFGKPNGYIMTTPEGEVAKNVSIVVPSQSNTDFQEKELKGNGLLVDVASKVRILKAEAEIFSKNPSVDKLNSKILFEASTQNEVPALPDEVFKRLNLSEIQKNDLMDLTDEDLAQLGGKIFDDLISNPSKKLSFKDLDLTPQTTSFIQKNQYLDPHTMSVTWDDYGRLIITLALKIIRGNTNFNFVIGVGRGGLAIAKALSQILHKPLATTITSSYKGTGECERSKLLIANDISIGDESQLEGKGILVDDLVESGTTLKETKEFYVKNKITGLSTAVLFQKPLTEVTPNFYVQTVDSKCWIVLPDEIFERLNLTGIEKKDICNMSDEKISQLTYELFENLPENPKKKIELGVINQLLLKYA